MELTATQLIDSTLNEVQKAEYLSLKSKEDNFDGLSQEEQIRFNEFKKMLTKAKSTQHIIPLKEEFKKVFPQVASHFNSDETKAIIAKVITNITPAQLLEAVIQKNITTTEDGVEKNIGKTSGFAIKDLNKAIKGFTGGATDEASLIVGVFKFADYGFKDDSAVDEQGKALTEMEWDLNKRVGGRGWRAEFLKAIKTKGGAANALKKAVEHSSPEFKEWLKVETPKKGRATTTFQNANEFYSKFGMIANEKGEAITEAEHKKAQEAAAKAAAKK